MSTDTRLSTALWRECQSQRKLDETGFVRLRGNRAKRRHAANLGCRRAKLYAVKQVEDFFSELEVRPFGVCRLLEHREIKVMEAVASQMRIYAALIPEAIGAR